ncbi:MAG: cadmium-translocating P-type ATPase [Methylocystis sp.]|nr:cadmium-translocating P-type ATPase [Methylocystis sp.]MCA3585066.1 cadmium-translocating P-type ATPase [Methylocystis sp.]MCA3587783.1 cadmium-translocating P-type ATPase [Methylocystis sp.]MCA3592284.1 cadmium-translocating P-type ATPase [Methylocystis sp.]
MSAAAPGQARDFSTFIRDEGDGVASLELAVEGMRCAGCMASVERTVGKLDGVVSARVNLTSQRLNVRWREGAATPDQVIAAVAGLGFRAYPFVSRQAETKEAQEEKRLLRYLGVAAFAAMNIMLLSVSVWSGNASDITPETRDFFHWLSALIALPTAAYAGQPFFESATRALRARQVNMDVPITLGILLALGMSVVETLNHGEHAYFDSAVMLIFFLLVGRYLDQAMRHKTRAVAGNLAALKAETAFKYVSDKEVREVPIAAIAAGDLVLVRPGERISVDGKVVSGRSEIDQSLITGETAYAAIGTDAMVYAGTLNISGTLTIQVVHAASGTLLDEVNSLLEKATAERSRQVLLADRAAQLYAPLVHATALATFIGWVLAGLAWQQALIIAITVLIITCPCALGLAVPAVQVVAAGALFRRSVLLNQGSALERFAEADTVVFDKTGTLTLPLPQIANAADFGPGDLALAGRLALASRHPLAQAIVEASGAAMPLTATEEPGLGVRSTFEGREILLGRPSFCGAEEAAALVAERYPEASLMAFRDGGRVHVFAVQQALRPDAVETIQGLKALGLAIEILSGDRPAAVAEAARDLGIERFQAAMTPADKIRHIEALAESGRKVLMVGDGLNDAPALAAAHVSLSPVTAVHLTQAAADAVFLGARLSPVLAAVSLSRRARALMVQNLRLAVLYNAIAVPLAIAGYATPLVAALAMSGSSVIVTLNALRAQGKPGAGP